MRLLPVGHRLSQSDINLARAEAAANIKRAL
jgi:hypothetical protein